jgi:hypothetical protein
LVPRNVRVKLKLPFLPSLTFGLPSWVKTDVETQSSRATDGSWIKVTFPFFTLNWIFRNESVTACCVVLPL